MIGATPLSNTTLLVTNTLLIAGVLAVDVASPLGIVVWMLYLVPLILAMFSSQRAAPLIVAAGCTVGVLLGLRFSPPPIAGLPLWVALANRGIGVLTFWALALVARQHIAARQQLFEQGWIRATQRDLGACMQGEQSCEALGDNILRCLCEALGAPVAALYLADAGQLRRVASYALESQPAAPGVPTLAVGEGLLGQAVKSRVLLSFDDVPESHLAFTSALGRSRPRQLVAVPAQVDGSVIAGLELGLLRPLTAPQRALIEAVSEPIAVALRSCLHRERLAALLAQTRLQAESLESQQAALTVANAELEQQSASLRETQTRLEAQQTELEQINVELEEQTRAVEQQRDELLRTQAELVVRSDELARASQYKSEFLANMSHELRTPLNSTLILARLLADNKPGNLNPEQVKAASTIHAAGNDLLTLINDILDLSRIESGKLDLTVEAQELSAILTAVERTFQPLAAEKRLALTVVAAPDLPPTLRTDSLKLQQILRNLLANAIKFTAHGTVSLRVSRADAQHLAFAVEDTGEGIAHDKLGIIFEAFRQADGTTQRRHGGTGLGLTISRQLAQRLGGDIEVESSPGKGSRFTLLLPLTPPEEPAQGRSRPPPPRAQPPSPPPPTVARLPEVADDRDVLTADSRSVLVVEDDLRFAEILRDLAREQGFRCLVAMTASEALALAEQYMPSAVLLDVHLPDGSGLWVLERIKAHPRLRGTPIHVVSVGDYARPALELGAIGHVLKPARREQLIAAFRRIEDRLEQKLRRLLVVEDNPQQRESLLALLASDDIEVTCAASSPEALELLRTRVFDCMILDLNLAGESGLVLLEKLAGGEAFSFPPVIVYTGQALSRDEERSLRRFAGSIVIKGARSPERLLAEVALFLHKVDAEMSPGAQRLLRTARDRETAFEGRNILLAEDDVRNVFALSSVLEPRGARLRIARNGKEALELLERADQDAAARIDLVLMDVMMPEMDGLTAIQRIRSHPAWKKLPIIALTAKAMPDDRERCLKAGANDYIAKPLDVDKLVALVKVWMPK